jgi:hypothetical protein
MKLIDGLPGIFTDVFGDEGGTLYTPQDGEPKLIKAIWMLGGGVAVVGALNIEERDAELHVSAADIPEPKEGDTAVRQMDGLAMRICNPITPDDQGMWACTLQKLPPSGS